MKAYIMFLCDSPYGEYKKCDYGYVDGYVRGGNDVPCAVIILEKSERFVLAQLNHLSFIKYVNWK